MKLRYLAFLFIVSLILFVACDGANNNNSSAEANISSALSGAESEDHQFMPESITIIRGESVNKTVNTYDKNGQRLTSDLYMGGIEDILKISSISFIYNEHHEIVVKTITQYTDNYPVLQEKTYNRKTNAEGAIISETKDIIKASGTETHTLEYFYIDSNTYIVYEKDAGGNILETEKYEILDENGSFRQIVENEDEIETVETLYDDKGRPIKELYRNSETIFFNSIREYDDKDNIVKSTNKDGVVTSYNNTYEGKKIVSAVKSVDGEVFSTLTYEYDCDGNVVYEKETDQGGNVLLETTKTWVLISGD